MAETFAKMPYNIIVSFDQHDGMFLMSTPPVPPIVGGRAWHLGAAVERMSCFGLGTNRWNDDVQFDGQPVASVLNSAWPIAPHWNVTPPFTPNNPNLFIPLLIIGSKSSNILSVGSVVAKQGPIAVTIPFVKYLGVNNACNDPLLMPTSAVVHLGSTVDLGFTIGDLVAAAAQYAMQVAVDQVIRLLGKGAGRVWRHFKPPKPDGLINRVGANILGRFKPNIANAGDIPLDSALARILDNSGTSQTVGELGGATLVKTALKGVGGTAGWAWANPISSWRHDGQYAPSIPDRVGDWIDGRSPLHLPPLHGPTGQHP